MRNVIRALIPLTFILAVAVTGCYTVISHPENERDYRADQTSDCLRCHVDYGDYPYGHYYSPDPEYWWEHNIYVQYYAEPWWWDYYDYPGADGSGRSTKFDRVDGASEPPPPPYITGDEGYPVTPVIINLPVQPPPAGGGTSGQQARPETGGDETDSRSKGNDSSEQNTKTSRQSSPSNSTTDDSRPEAVPKRPEPKNSPPAEDKPTNPDEKGNTGGSSR